ncbi:phosphate/phosphite/phosphonate ABC transporter substrate-binding protein [bacterium]|nr:phosphate/phosphite/phosphonate ABC transporter substrate-binding protein [bacterium]
MLRLQKNGNFNKIRELKTIFLVSYFTFIFIGSLVAQDFPESTSEEPYNMDVNYGNQPTEEAIPAPPPKPPPPPASIRMAQKVVMIGRVPYMSVKEMMGHVKTLLGYLRKEMGVKEVRLVTSKDYAGILEALSRGTIDFAWLGPTAYVLGKEKNAMIPLAKTKLRSGSSYRGVFIARKDSQILGIEDIKGKVMGFVDPESASGYLYPLYILKRSKINPFKDCKKVEFLKKHDLVLSAVLEKRIDAGVCLEDTLGTLKDKTLLEQIMILGKTDPVPSDVIACREDCPLNLREKFKETLLKIKGNPQSEKGAGAGEKLSEFLPVSDEEFNSVRDVLRAIGDIIQKK